MSNDLLLKVAGYIIASVGAALVFCGGLIGYIWQSHKKQNSDEHDNLFTKTDEQGNEISEIKGALGL